MISNYTSSTPEPGYPFEIGGNVPVMEALIRLLSPTVTPIDYYATGFNQRIAYYDTFGLVSDLTTGISLMHIFAHTHEDPDIHSGVRPRQHNAPQDYTDFFFTTLSDSDFSFGSFLVRDTQVLMTPIPAASWLMVSGLFGVIWLSRKGK